MKYILYLAIFFTLFLNSCAKVRESAGVNRKSVDESVVIENPPLVIPPDFNLLPPEQLEEKKIENLETEFAQEILFGLDENEIGEKKQLSTMNQILLEAEALEVSTDIRQEIDESFAQEIKTDGIFQIDFEDEVEVLDAIKESERIRNKKFEGDPISEGDVPIKNEIIKKKKKKRFIIF